MSDDALRAAERSGDWRAHVTQLRRAGRYDEARTVMCRALIPTGSGADLGTSDLKRLGWRCRREGPYYLVRDPLGALATLDGVFFSAPTAWSQAQELVRSALCSDEIGIAAEHARVCWARHGGREDECGERLPGEDGRRIRATPCDTYRPYCSAPAYCWCGWIDTQHGLPLCTSCGEPLTGGGVKDGDEHLCLRCGGAEEQLMDEHRHNERWRD